MTNFKNHRNAIHKHDEFLTKNVRYLIDHSRQVSPTSVVDPTLWENVYHTDNNADWNKKLNIKINSQSYVGPIRAKFNLPAATGAVIQTQQLVLTVTGAAWTAAVGDYCFAAKSNVTSYNNRTSNLSFSDYSTTVAPTAAQLQTQINTNPVVALNGGLTVALNGGTIALGTLDFTVTWNSAGPKPQLFCVSTLDDVGTGSYSWVPSITSGKGYKANVGLYLFDRIKLKSGNTEVYDWDYRQVVKFILDRMEPEQWLMYQEMVGAYDFNNGTVYAPIFVPWSREFHEDYNHEMFHHLYPAGGVHEELEFELTFAPNTWMCEGASCTAPSNFTFELHHIEYSHSVIHEAKHKQDIKSIGWQMRGLHFEVIQSTAITSGTLTKVDLSSLSTQGSTKFYMLTLIKVADYDTNFDFYKSEKITELTLRDDSKRMFDDLTDANDVDLYHRIDLDKRFPSDNGWVYYIDFGSHGVKHAFDYSGAWNKLKINDISMEIKHAVGENCYLFVMAGILVDYVINQKGRFRRVFGGDIYE